MRRTLEIDRPHNLPGLAAGLFEVLLDVRDERLEQIMVAHLVVQERADDPLDDFRHVGDEVDQRDGGESVVFGVIAGTIGARHRRKGFVDRLGERRERLLHDFQGFARIGVLLDPVEKSIAIAPL